MILDNTAHCEYCNPDSFITAKLAKQNAMFTYLDSRQELPAPYSSDKIIDNATCGKERPDRIYDCGDKIIIVECDEYQHKGMPLECEKTRMCNIGQYFGGIPVYFIRWNPDSYEPKHAKRALDTITKRNKLLGDFLRDIICERIQIPKALVSAIYMYYDGWDGIQNESWKVLTEFVSTV